MTYSIDIPICLFSVEGKVDTASGYPLLRKNVQGGVNVQFLLNLEAEAWLDRFTPGWELRDSNRLWDHIPERQLWFCYRDLESYTYGPIGPATFEFQNANHAMLFKLTWV